LQARSPSARKGLLRVLAKTVWTVLNSEPNISYSQAQKRFRNLSKSTVTSKVGDRVARFVLRAKTYFFCKKGAGKYN
jgi:hypothetical protein